MAGGRTKQKIQFAEFSRSSNQLNRCLHILMFALSYLKEVTIPSSGPPKSRMLTLEIFDEVSFNQSLEVLSHFV